MLRPPKRLTALPAALAVAFSGATARSQELPLPPLPAAQSSASPLAPDAAPQAPPPPPPGAPPRPTGPPPPPPSMLPAPPPAYRASAEELRFEPDEPGLMLLRQNGAVPVTRVSAFPTFLWFERGLAPLYAPVCPGPCITRIQPGEYRFALSKDGGRAVPSAVPVDIRGPSAIHGSYVDKSGVRIGGIVLAFGGTAGGIVMIALSARSHDVCDSTGYCFRQTTFNTPLAVGGVGVLLGSVIIGSVLASQHDEALITVTPLVGWNRPERIAPMAASPVPSVQGAALTMRF